MSLFLPSDFNVTCLIVVVIIQFVLKINKRFILTVACMSFLMSLMHRPVRLLQASDSLSRGGDLSYVLAVHA